MPHFRSQPILRRNRLPGGKASPPAAAGRPWRDILAQMVATVMIPLTVASAGLYYTRWQQNLNDLKTMIDLVSDKDPERRKYGVAMFEYLLKNDKVPVEFVAAQLNYANASSDRELLPMMEEALRKVAASDSRVDQVYLEALGRLPVRLYVYAMNEQQRGCIRRLIDTNREEMTEKITIPGTSRATWAGARHELRVLTASDRPRAAALVKMFAGRGLTLHLVDLSDTLNPSRKFKPNTLDLWFGNAPLPPACAAA